MPAKVDCPECSQTVMVPDEYVRKSWSCPACRHRFVPDPDVHVERPPREAGAHAPAATSAVAGSAGGAESGGGRGASSAGFGWTALAGAFAAGAVVGAAAMALFG